MSDPLASATKASQNIATAAPLPLPPGWDPNAPPSYEAPTVKPVPPEWVRSVFTIKPGWQTTEFWFSAVAGIFPLLISGVSAPVKAAVMGAVGAVYTISRTIVKARR